MKPTEIGWYWLRQNHKNRVTGEIQTSPAECVWVTHGSFRRKHGLMVIGCVCGGWKEFVADVPDYWTWSDRIVIPDCF